MGSRPTRPAGPRQGGEAPGFLLADSPSTRLGLADFGGRWLVVAFHVADWDPVAESQLRSLSGVAAALRERGIEIVSISSDTVWSHTAFARVAGVTIPLLADDEPPGATAAAFGIGSGRGGRGLVLIDPAGRIGWSQVVDRRVDPGIDGLLSALERLLPASSGSRNRMPG
jgi:peroxiredoxin